MSRVALAATIGVTLFLPLGARSELAVPPLTGRVVDRAGMLSPAVERSIAASLTALESAPQGAGRRDAGTSLAGRAGNAAPEFTAASQDGNNRVAQGGRLPGNERARRRPGIDRLVAEKGEAEVFF